MFYMIALNKVYIINHMKRYRFVYFESIINYNIINF